MKRVLLIAALALGFSGVVLAQQTTPAPDTGATVPAGKHHAPNPHRETAKMTKELHLTPDQAAKIEPILSDRDAKLAAIKADSSLTSDESREKMKGVRKSATTQLRAILTPEQATQMKTAKKAKKSPGADTPPPADN